MLDSENTRFIWRVRPLQTVSGLPVSGVIQYPCMYNIGGFNTAHAGVLEYHRGESGMSWYTVSPYCQDRLAIDRRYTLAPEGWESQVLEGHTELWDVVTGQWMIGDDLDPALAMDPDSYFPQMAYNDVGLRGDGY